MAQPNGTSAFESGAEGYAERLNTKELGVLLFEQTAPDLGIFNQLRNEQLQSAPRTPEINAMLDNFSLTDNADNAGETVKLEAAFSPPVSQRSQDTDFTPAAQEKIKAAWHVPTTSIDARVSKWHTKN